MVGDFKCGEGMSLLFSATEEVFRLGHLDDNIQSSVGIPSSSPGSLYEPPSGFACRVRLSTMLLLSMASLSSRSWVLGQRCSTWQVIWARRGHYRVGHQSPR